MVKDPFLEHRVSTADPIELIGMLYEHALHTTREARLSLASRNIPARAAAISRTVSILGELEGSLDHSAGGSLSRNLATLYQYMRKRLTQANLEQEDAPLAEVESLLKTLSEGWSTIRPARAAEQPAQPAQDYFAAMNASHAPELAYAADGGYASNTWTA